MSEEAKKDIAWGVLGGVILFVMVMLALALHAASVHAGDEIAMWAETMIPAQSPSPALR